MHFLGESLVTGSTGGSLGFVYRIVEHLMLTPVFVDVVYEELADSVYCLFYDCYIFAFHNLAIMRIDLGTSFLQFLQISPSKLVLRLFGEHQWEYQRSSLSGWIWTHNVSIIHSPMAGECSIEVPVCS